ncbi:MAG TPA: lytic transglycosylase domain-containing protein [Methylomirabilota bacterium]|jgi:soluble lytic murein transglycosylase-like protein|nr:lytic transglycosylase domain-containing protein [Methylomirabilota bacterium]
MNKRIAAAACIVLGALALFAATASAQIATVTDNAGRKLFINDNPPVLVKPVVAKARTGIYLPADASLSGRLRPAVHADPDSVDRIVMEAAEKHHVDPALIRAVIETESGWNVGAVSRRGAAGLMQLHPATAQRLGVHDIFNPQQNIDAGARYLRALLERYNGNLDLALAAYNAGEGAVDRHGGIPPFRETRNYVQKVQNAYLRPGSGRLDSPWGAVRAIRKETDSQGRTVFTND